MKSKRTLFHAILAAILFINSLSNAETIVLKLLDGATWNGEVGQTVSVKYNDRVQDKEIIYTGKLTRAANSYIVVEDEFLFVNQIITIQTIINANKQVPPNAEQPKQVSPNTEQSKEIPKNVSKDKKGSDDYDWVDVEGIGITPEEAKKDAWRNAIEQAVGVYITSKSLIENGKLVEDVITSHSKGFVENFKLLETKIVGGVTHVRMEVQVATKSVFEKLQSSGGELEFITVDGESKYAKSITQKQQAQDAVLALSDVMEGYPEKLIDIKISGLMREALPGVFKDRSSKHYIVPITFSWNNEDWTIFANNLNEYLNQVGIESKKVTLQSDFRLIEGRSNSYGQMDDDYIGKDSWLQKNQGWERWLLTQTRGDNKSFSWGKIPGKFKFNTSSKDIYHKIEVIRAIESASSHDSIHDVVVVMNKGFRGGNSYAITRELWDSILHNMKQVPAFDLRTLDDEGAVIQTRNFEEGELSYSTFHFQGSEHENRRGPSGNHAVGFHSLPSAPGFTYTYGGGSRGDAYDEDLVLFTDGLEELLSSQYFDNSEGVNSPRIMVIHPYFTGQLRSYNFNNSAHAFFSEYTYEYAIALNEIDVKRVRKIDISERYIIDLRLLRHGDRGYKDEVEKYEEKFGGCGGWCWRGSSRCLVCGGGHAVDVWWRKIN